MSLITAAIVTRSQITVRRVPIEFMEIELATLEEMGFTYERSAEYIAGNGQTRLVDIVTHPSDLRAPIDKIHPMPFPDRKSTRLNSSHVAISYAVFCLE